MKPQAARSYQFSTLEDKVEELSQFHLRLDAFIRLELARLPKEFAREGQGRPSQKREFLDDIAYADEYYLLETAFMRNLRYSTLVSAQTLLETGLNGICRNEHRRFRHRLSV